LFLPRGLADAPSRLSGLIAAGGPRGGAGFVPVLKPTSKRDERVGPHRD
jgi:hypothetical protein